MTSSSTKWTKSHLLYFGSASYENLLMKQFSCTQQEAILRRHGADYEQLPVNLCEPVLMAALGQLMLSDEKAPAPALDQPMRRRLAEQLWGRGAGEIRDALLSVINPLCERCGADGGMRAYLQQAASDAALRMSSADQEGIENAFSESVLIACQLLHQCRNHLAVGGFLVAADHVPSQQLIGCAGLLPIPGYADAVANAALNGVDGCIHLFR